MTITAQTAKSGPYSGNGSTTVFDYTFKVDDESHLVVTVLGTDGVSESIEVLNTDYTVTGVGNPSGGTIVMSVALIVGERLTITRNVALTQEVDLQNRGAVNPETLELAYDKLTQISQDQQEQLGRALKVDLFETADLNQLTLNVNALAAIDSDISTVANISPDVTTVAGIDTEVTTVAGVSTDVSTVSGISADVTTVAADGTDIGVVAGISADVTTVSGISADVTTVSGISADVTTVAADGTDIGVVAGISADVSTVSGISADVTTVAADGTDIGVVAGISADVTTVAANVADVTNFADVYLGPSATDPTLRNDGTALQEGDLYFNTADDVMNVYEGTVWVAAFASLSGALIAANNLSDLNDASVALTNLGVTTTAAELNTLDGVTATTAELNFVDGVTSNIQTQINARLKLDDKATQAAAEAGTDNSVYMTPLRTAQAIEELSPAPSELTEAQATDDTSTVFGTVSGQRLNQETKASLNVLGAAPMFACRAWVNFDGTGTVAIRASGNVSSITDNGTGDYTVNFTTAMPDANYAVAGVHGSTSGGGTIRLPDSSAATYSISAFRFNALRGDGAHLVDAYAVTLAVFR